MKIAFLTTDNRAHTRDFAATVPYFGTAPEALLDGMAEIPELEVHVVSCTQQPMKSPEKLAPNIWFHSLHVPKIGWMRTGYQGCIRATRRQLQLIRPDLVHGQGTERDCAISAVFSRFPNVLTIHGNLRLIAQVTRAKPFSFPWLAARLEQFTLRRTRNVVCITRYTRDAVKNLVPKTWVVPNAVHGSYFKLTPEPDDSGTILCVGVICDRKNQNRFIRALDPLAAKHKFKVVFFGQAPKDDPYVIEFLDLVAKRPWCEYAGFAGREKLQAVLKHTALVALPSLEDNCPMVVLEAMAAGVPVLAAQVGGVPDLVEDGKNGLFCDPLDATSMRAGVARLLNNRELALNLATTARQQAHERYLPRAVAQRHLDIYREILNKQS